MNPEIDITEIKQEELQETLLSEQNLEHFREKFSFMPITTDNLLRFISEALLHYVQISWSCGYCGRLNGLQ